MGLFGRRRTADRDEPHPATEWGASEGRTGDDVVDDGRPRRPETSSISTADRAAIDTALTRFAEVGGDVDDLASIGALFDRAVAREEPGLGAQEVVDVLGHVIGEHLVRHGRYDWKVVSDAFGTDLGVSARRRDLSVIPATIVATRWINREQGWVPGVIGHLARLGIG